MRLTKVLALIAVVALAVPLANAADTKHKFSFGLGYFMPTDDYSETVDEYTITMEADDAIGYGLGYEYYHNELMSFAASIWFADHDVTIDVPDELTVLAEYDYGSVAWMPILFDANFHVLKGKPVDLYLGPTLGYSMWDDWEFEGDTQKIKDQFVYGLNFGLDVPFAENWAFTAGLRYLFVEAEPDEDDSGDAIGVDPLVLTVGIGYKF
mgnify:CR=1 FL=1